MSSPELLAIVEMGGYPDFSPLYQRKGLAVQKAHSMRKAQAWLKKNKPLLVVTEFHYDPDLRDRMSNLESLLATLQRYSPQTRVIVFIDRERLPRLEKVRERYPVYGDLSFPIDEASLERLVDKALSEVAV